jgi:hypothetical protein
MKRQIFVALFLAALCAGMAFADYTVEAVSGKVERELSPGKWEAIKAGDVLSPATVVNTGINSRLVINDGGKSVTIRAMQKGALESLVPGGAAGEVRVGGVVSGANTSVSSRGTANISTASARASRGRADDEDGEEDASEEEANVPPTQGSAVP